MYDHKAYQKKWRETHKDYRKKWFKKNSGKYKEQRKNCFLLKNYGISFEQYNELFAKQKGCCKICNRHQSEFKRSLAVDHDHKTNKVRGLLCHNCNKALGGFLDDIPTLEQAIVYLRESLL